jgi:hypothetical protein
VGYLLNALPPKKFTVGVRHPRGCSWKLITGRNSSLVVTSFSAESSSFPQRSYRLDGSTPKEERDGVLKMLAAGTTSSESLAALNRIGWSPSSAQPLRQAIVTGIGHRRGEGMALLEAV